MSRSRKQRERKLKAKLHEAQVKNAAVRAQLSMQNDVLVNYVGGVAKFGHDVLMMISLTNFIDPIKDHHQFGIHVLSQARHMGFIEPDPHHSGTHANRKYVLTHMCKELLGEKDGQAD